MRKTLFGQCTYSFFDDQFCRQFVIGRDLDWTEEYRDLNRRMTNGMGEEIPCPEPPAYSLWLFDNGFNPRIRKAIDDLCVTNIAMGVEGFPELLRVPPPFPKCSQIVLIICWKFHGETHVFGTLGCQWLPEPSYRFGQMSINPQLTPADLENCKNECSKAKEILSQSIGEFEREVYYENDRFAREIGTSHLVLIALEDHRVIEACAEPLVALSRNRPQILHAGAEIFGVYKW
jgi:hypothetical protein